MPTAGLIMIDFTGNDWRKLAARFFFSSRRRHTSSLRDWISDVCSSDLNVLLHEALAGTKIVKAFGREAHEAERFDRVNQRLLALALKDHRTDEVTDPVIAGVMTPGDFFSFTAAVALLYGPVRQISRIMNTVQQSTGAVERVFEVLDTPP